MSNSNNQVEDLKIDKEEYDSSRNMYSEYGESDERFIREEDRKQRWLSHKTKFLTLSYSRCSNNFQTEPSFGTLEYGLSLSDDKNYMKEVFEVGHLRARLKLEQVSDSLLRRINAFKELVLTLEDGILPDADDEERSFSVLKNYMKEFGDDVFEDSSKGFGLDASTTLLSSDLFQYHRCLQDYFAYSVVKKRGNHDILKSEIN